MGTATYLSITRATATTAFAAKISGDTANRYVVKSDGETTWSDGAGAGAVTLKRLTANSLGVTGGLFDIERTASSDPALITSLAADTQNRFSIQASGRHEWGTGTAAADTYMYRGAAQTLVVTGSSANTGALHLLGTGSASRLTFGPDPATPTSSLYEQAAGRLQTSNQFRAAGGVATYTKSGVPTDSDFDITPQNGHLAVDQTNIRLWIRVNGTWRYAALTTP